MALFKLLLTFSFVAAFGTANASQSCVTIESSGTANKGHLVFIPGFVSDARVWRPMAKQLSADYQVHLVSIAGMASSPACQQSDSIYQAAKIDILQYIKQQKLNNVVVIGHSMGGLMSLDIALEQPTSIAAAVSVDGLPFIGPVFTRSNSTQVSDIQMQANGAKAMYAKATEQQLAQMTSQGAFIQTNQAHKIEELVNMAKVSHAPSAASALYTVMTTDLRPQLTNLNVPYMLIGASGGFNSDAQHQAMAALYQQQLANTDKATLVMNTQGRHFLMWDEPQWLADQILGFVEAL